MSWAQSLYDTYCVCESAIGICIEESQAKMLLPEGHNLIEPEFIVTIREEGSFYKAEKISKGKNDPRFFIAAPCTEDSASRSGKDASDFPHPIFDKLQYIVSQRYRENLLQWITFLEDQPRYSVVRRMLNAIYNYMKTERITTDISDIKQESMVCFCVNIVGEKENRMWRIPEMSQAWVDYHRCCLLADDRKDTCYISGNILPCTEKHPKSINRSTGNAKLISGNDGANFTFRGRFREARQAATVSYDASQKMHQALRWLIATRGMHCSSQAVIAWAIDEKNDVEDPYGDSLEIYKKVATNDSGSIRKAEAITDMNYSIALRRVLLGYGNTDSLKERMRQIAVLAVDAATTGRMSVTYYREFQEMEYHERIANWHEGCRWYQPLKGADTQHGYFIGAPSAENIIKGVLGKKPGKSESYDKMAKGIRERLLHFIFDGENIPGDMLNTVLIRASNPLGLENKSSDSLRWQEWEAVLGVACGLWRLHYLKKGDEYELALEEKRQDRDYLYGRLLAFADRIEAVARFKQGKRKEDARATNAIRYMTAFSQHPFRTWKIIWEQLNPYIQQLKGADWYINQIGSIMENFKEGEYESDRALDGRYLMGYFLQRQALREKNKNNDGGNENESDK